MAVILAVDDDKAILSMIEAVLTRDGHRVRTLSDPEALDISAAACYDLILLDVMMPGIDGFALCSRLRSEVDCPIVFLTARTDEAGLVEGLSIGADDYICKPFGVAELRSRVEAHLRRERREHCARLSLGRAALNLSAKQLSVDGAAVPLTRGEFDICRLLAENRGQVFTREQILERVFGFDSDSSDGTIATHIKNIRAKLSELDYGPIKTVWGVGYKWEE